MTIVVTTSTSVTFGDLLAELYARGFDFLNQDAAGRSRAKRWINQSYLELCESNAWPFLSASTSGQAPLEIPDLRQVLSVTVVDRELWGLDRRTLSRRYSNLEAEGEASSWYLDGNTLRVYPVSTEPLSVRYLMVPPDLVDDTDEPVVPGRFADVIVDGAVIRALKDTDNWEVLPTARREYDIGIARMENSLLDRDYGPEFIEVVSGGDW